MITQTSANEPQRPATSVSGSSAEFVGGPRQDGLSVLDLLTLFALRKRMILTITVAFAIVGIVASLLLPKEYTASVTLLPPQQNSTMGSALAAQLGNLGGGLASLAGGSLGLKNSNDMFVGMLKSRTVEDAMVDQYGLMAEYHPRYASDARKVFESRVKIDGNQKDGIIRISVEDRSADRAAELANGYVQQFRRLSEHLAITEASQRRLFFEQQLGQAKDHLADAEEALKQTELTTGLIQMDSQARALIESAAQLRAQIAAKEVEMQAMQTYATSENAQLLQAQQELDALRSQLAKLGGSEAESSTSILVPKGRVPQAGLEYVRKMRDVKYYETIFEILARQFELAKLDEAKQGALIQVIDAAVPPDRRSSPKRAIITILTTLAGFFVALVTALLQASFQSLKSDPSVSPRLSILRDALSFRKSG
ncbi:MAG: GNVR domain-containing protein [Terracidiphilus sp.]